MLMVACLAIISGVNGVRVLGSRSFASVWGGRGGRATSGGWDRGDFFIADLIGLSGRSSMPSSTSLTGDSLPESDSDSMSFPNLSMIAILLQ